MCGIVAVLRRRSDRASPDLDGVQRDLAAVAAGLAAVPAPGTDPAGALDDLAGVLERADAALRGAPGVSALLDDRVGLVGLEHGAEEIAGRIAELEVRLDAESAAGRLRAVEAVNAALVRAKDAAWAIGHDRLPAARAVEDLGGGSSGRAAVEAFTSIGVALSALDRLEVRGRDSAGLHVLVAGHGLDLDDPTVARLVAARAADRLFGAGAVRTPDGHLAFVYKTAAEIGELGDNTARLRDQIRGDELLRLALVRDEASASVLGHTRWASVGIISEANAHPLDQAETEGALPGVFGVLNGDVDNYADLQALEGLHVAPEITTDAKVIPALTARRLAAGEAPGEAFRATVAALEGSVAVAAQVGAEPERLYLALRGSGQALYVGCAPDAFVVASEPYGLVEEAGTYLRLDGETPNDPDNPASAGQIVVLDATRAGRLDGIRRVAYDGRSLPPSPDELQRTEITTRDVDRGDSPHYLLKEMIESPGSFRKTLRGKLVEVDGRLRVALGDATLPPGLRARLREGSIRRIVVIGQGTAAVAGQSLAAALAREVTGSGVVVQTLVATELSGFGLADDMHDTLVVAISQSGTTTDTNRTVDVVRARGGAVVSIVNRRQSDLVDKSDGVLYTSDGRDVEMSVASTKAFYAQIAAGFLLAFALADELAPRDGESAASPRRAALLAGLRDLPDALLELLGRREHIAACARRHAPTRRSWAVVGNGPNRVAAQEVRIKLSELCYKSIACDVTEDKKHIDLSSEPLILVCAAGTSGSNADDVGKELAIYRAHKAATVVVATDGETRYSAAHETISVPPAHPELAFVLSAMAGHLFGYEAALAIDATARPLRRARGAIEALVAERLDAHDVLERLAEDLAEPAREFHDGLRTGRYDGALEAGTAVRLAALLRYASGLVPLESFQTEFGKVGTPSTVVEDLTAGLTAAIEELTRPVDAIKHQAKTVTVGISRSDETMLRVPLVQEALAAGVARDSLSYRALRTLADLDVAVEAVIGYTRYRIEGDPDRPDATIHVVDKGGVALGIPSRTEENPVLRGSKHRVATQREVTVVRGRADGRTLVFVPEVKGTQTTGLALLHARFRDRLPGEVVRRVLQGYQGRYAALQDAVTETEPVFHDELLGQVDVVDLLTEPVFVLADRWRSR